PPKLSSDPASKKYPPCARCGALRIGLYDVPTEKLKVPDMGIEDFMKAMQKGRSSVSPDELTRFTEWTRQFGQEG
ncbi:unnamed protein product, partial [Phaeothamnion confervicola]